MKYQSELIKEIIDTRGHDKSSLHYESECIETWIEENKGAYPKLTDYQSEWINYINENPIGNFPYETITDVTNATIDNVVPLGYQSAILKGSTKYRDIGTGEILETFEEGRNLELVSVKMPVLTTTGKNLFQSLEWESGFISSTTGAESNHSQYIRTKNYIDIQPNATYTATGYMEYFMFYDSDKNFISATQGSTTKKSITFTTPSNAKYLRLRYFLSSIPTLEAMLNTENMLELGEQSTGEYEPYKSNILTVNEEVTLRGIGDVKDTLDCLTGEVVERIGEMVLNGSEEWSIPTNFSNGDCKAYSLSVNGLTSNIVCDGLKIIPNTLKYGTEEGVFVNGNLLIVKKNIATRELLKQWLSQNPIMIQYQLATESVKTIDLTITNQDGESLNELKPIEGTMNLSTSGENIRPLFSGKIPVEAITQNLSSFIEED